MNKKNRIAVKATRGNVMGTHVVDDEPIAVLDRPTSAFVLTLSTHLGKSESWTLDLIVQVCEFGFEPPW